jgi:hypothetical protein
VSWRGLILFIAAFSLFGLGYTITGAQASPLAEGLFRLSPPLAAALWVEADARRLRRVPCYEFGAFVFLGWLVAVPAYCFWSRGRAGWRLAMALIGLILAPSLVQLVSAALLRAAGS